MKNILIIKHGALGDLIQADGVLRDIRDHFASAKLTLLTAPQFESLMSRCPHIDSIVTDSRAPLWKVHKQWSLFRSVKQGRFDLIIDLQNSSRTSLYHRWFFHNIPWFKRTTEQKPVSGLKGQLAILEQNGIATILTMHPNVSWMVDDVTGILSEGQITRPYIALIPGCSAQHPEKRWPYYAELGQKLIEQGYDVVNILGPDEKHMANQLPGFSPVSLGRYLTWFELAGLLKKAAFVVGNDTGPSHIASCLQQKGIALFGPHTSVARSEIVRGEFNAIQVEDLSSLQVEQVFAKIALSQLS